MTLGFKRQFETFVEEGSKRHTIRAKGGRAWRPGMIADCFVNPRQKSMRCIGRWPVVKVEPITIRRGTVAGGLLEITINGERLSPDEANALAWRDGFRSMGRDGAVGQMAGFWTDLLPFEGDLIHWDFDRPTGDRKIRCNAIEAPHAGAISRGRCKLGYGHAGGHEWPEGRGRR